jgi:phosphate transport system protein
MLHQELEMLKEKLLESATLVENMIEKSIEGLLKKDKDLLLKIIEEDEARENDLEIQIDEKGIELIARYQPHAKDLRTIVMILKMNNDLERIGDEAVNIAQSALFLIERPMVKPLIDIPRMGEEAIKMLQDSIKAFLQEDSQLAREVCVRDAIVDGLRDQIWRELITFMASDPTTIERSLHLLRISRCLERVADLATNLAEDTVYIVEGEIIKHHRGNF